MAHLYPENRINPLMRYPVVLVLPALAVLNAAVLIRFGAAGLALPLFLFAFVFLTAKALAEPRFIIIYYLAAAFVVNGLPRYMPNVSLSLGLVMDGLLILGVLAALWSGSRKELPWQKVKNPLVVLFTLWFMFTALCALNPQSASLTAWFYAMRGVALYFWLAIPLIFLFFNRNRDLQLFLRFWGVFTILAFLKGYQQVYFGPDVYEKMWLDSGGALTHVIWGKLRAFSFYSDAGQFGAAQAHAAITFLLILLKAKRNRDRLFFGLVSICGLYGMLLSGTRGAIFIPLAAVFFYVLSSRNPLHFLAGILAAVLVVVFFKFTYIGQGNDHIRRMRTAFNSDDASLQVRLENQKILAGYLKDKPLGGGVGSAGYWGRRFSPGTVLAETPTDSWYVRIWAEQGIIGLSLYLSLLFAILVRGMIITRKRFSDPELRNTAAALLCGCFGIIVASYGNSLLGQNPTGAVVQFSLAFLFMAPALDREQAARHDEKKAGRFL